MLLPNILSNVKFHIKYIKNYKTTQDTSQVKSKNTADIKSAF